MAGTHTVSQANIPGYLNPQLQEGFKQFGAAQNNFPSIAEIPGQIPQLNIPGLTPEQQQLITQITSTGGASPYLTASAQQLQQLTAGPIGSSPLTQQAMEAYRQQVVPQLLQQQALAGRANGGAALEAVAQGEQSAFVPLIQQEISNREAAVGQYGQLQGASLQSMAQALEAAGLPREIAQQVAQAQFEQQQQRLQFETGIQTLPLNLIPGLIGQESTTKPTGMTAEDWVSGIGKGLSVSGIFGGG